MGKIIAKLEGLAESHDIDGGYLGYTFTLGDSDLAQVIRDALELGSSELEHEGRKRSKYRDVIWKDVYLRVTVELMNG